jgi:hypothetical protein
MMANLVRPLRLDLVIIGFASVATALWLFYIDEGKYNLSGLFQPDSLFFLIIYILAFFWFQLTLHKLLQNFMFKGRYAKGLAAAVALVSLPASLAIFGS